jgi:hypothetical protein
MGATIDHVQETLTGSPNKTDDAADSLYEVLLNWGFEEGVIEEGRAGINVSGAVRKHGDEYADHLAETFGTKHPFFAATAAGQKYQPGAMASEKQVKAVDQMVQEKTVVDSTTVQDAAPIRVDPMVVDITRTRATVLDRIPVQSQAGWTAKYNVISDRSEPIGYAPESDVIDLSDNSYGDFTMPTEEDPMKIFVDQINVSDFSQRAMSTLNYMDLQNTTLGQRTIEWALVKAAAYFYGDTSAGTGSLGYGSLGSANTFDGFAKIASDNGNQIDKSATSSNFLEDIKSELTTQVENTGLTYADAEIFVSPSMFDALENEANAVVRLDTFSEGIDFGGRQLSIKGTPVTECPNIVPSFDLPWASSMENEGNVFIVDRSATNFRALAPLFTLPLGRQGLADRAAMGEYGTLVDKSQGAHTLMLDSYDLSAA